MSKDEALTISIQQEKGNYDNDWQLEAPLGGPYTVSRNFFVCTNVCTATWNIWYNSTDEYDIEPYIDSVLNFIDAGEEVPVGLRLEEPVRMLSRLEVDLNVYRTCTLDEKNVI